MTWWAVEVRVRDGAAEGEAGLALVALRREEVAAWLVARTGLAAEERPDGAVVTVLPTEAEASRLLGDLAGLGGVEARLAELPEVDWATRWRDGLGPRSFGRLTVAPSWVDVRPRGDEVLVVLDPENAFGSGEHGSTRAALGLLERLLRPGDRMLDLGSGSGILAIAAARLGAAAATGVENDPEAVPVAERNARLNRVAETARFILGDAGALAPLLGPVDLVCSNILRGVNELLLPAIHAALRPGGVAVFSGMEVDEASRFLPRMAAQGLVAVDEGRDAGWWAVAGRRP